MPALPRFLIRLAAALLLATGPAAAQVPSAQAAFSADRLSEAEVRYLQGALAAQGAYDGLLDGRWGRGSQDALAAWAASDTRVGRSTWGAVRTLMRRFERERERHDWVQVWHDDDGIGHQMPQGLLEARPEGVELRYVSPDGGLVMLYRLDARLPTGLHDEFQVDMRAGTQPYRLESARLLVTAGEMRGGRNVYVRSDRAGTRWATHILLADDANAGRLALIAASFARERRPALEVPEGGLLAAVRDGVEPEVVEPAPAPVRERDPLEVALEALLQRAIDRALPLREGQRPVTAPEPEAPRRRAAPQEAVGFHVNTTDVVTADGLIERCGGEVETMRGRRARVLARDGAAGLAVVAVGGRSADWYAVRPDAVRRGDGFTMVGRTGDGVQLREGEVRRVDGARLRHDARAGNRVISAPLLDGRGRVMGVVLPSFADGDGDTRRAATGAALAAMLRDAGILFATEGGVGRATGGRPADGAGTLRLRCAG